MKKTITLLFLFALLLVSCSHSKSSTKVENLKEWQDGFNTLLNIRELGGDETSPSTLYAGKYGTLEATQDLKTKSGEPIIKVNFNIDLSEKIHGPEEILEQLKANEFPTDMSLTVKDLDFVATPDWSIQHTSDFKDKVGNNILTSAIMYEKKYGEKFYTTFYSNQDEERKTEDYAWSEWEDWDETQSTYDSYKELFETLASDKAFENAEYNDSSYKIKMYITTEVKKIDNGDIKGEVTTYKYNLEGTENQDSIVFEVKFDENKQVFSIKAKGKIKEDLTSLFNYLKSLKIDTTNLKEGDVYNLMDMSYEFEIDYPDSYEFSRKVPALTQEDIEKINNDSGDDDTND